MLEFGRTQIIPLSLKNQDLQTAMQAAHKEYPLILREGAAIGIRQRHASLGSQDTGKMLSNTSIICLWVWDNLGKLRIIPDMKIVLEMIFF